MPVFPSTALQKEYQRIGKAFQNLSSVFTSSGYQGTTMNTNMIKSCFERLTGADYLLVVSFHFADFVITMVVDAIYYAVIHYVEICLETNGHTDTSLP